MALTTYLLWSFKVKGDVLSARGPTQQHALDYIKSLLPEGGWAVPMRHNFFLLSQLYSRNHAPGWLHRPPDYLIETEVKNV